MKAYIQQMIREHHAYGPMLRGLEEGRTVAVTGICEPLRPWFLQTLAQEEPERPLVICLPDERGAQELYHSLGPEGALLYPARDLSFTEFDAASRDFDSQRLEVLCALALGRCQTVITSVEAACQVTLSRRELEESLLRLEVGQELEPQRLWEHLEAWGYQRCDRVEGKGQFAQRGGILDLYSCVEQSPLRLEFFGDTLESVRSFDVLTQRSLEERREAVISPARELCFSPAQRTRIRQALTQEMEKARGNKERLGCLRGHLEALDQGRVRAADCFLPLREQPVCLTDHCRGLRFCLVDTPLAQTRHRLAAEALSQSLEGLILQNKLPLPLNDALPLTELSAFFDRVSQGPCLCLETVTERQALTPWGVFAWESRPCPSHGQDAALLKELVEGYGQEGRLVLYMADNSLAAQHLLEFFEQNGVRALPWRPDTQPREGGVYVGVGQGPEQGFELPEKKCVLLCDGKAGAPRGQLRRANPVKKSARQAILSYADLEIGDYVVHANYGIGRFEGVEKIAKDGALRDFIKIRYAGSDVLYVPCSSLENVSKYIGAGADSDNLKLSKMGGDTWHKTRSRAKAAARDIAKDLLRLYAQRAGRKGHAFQPDSSWQQEFENDFPFTPTADQLRAAQEIKYDMERSMPMDRLLCGDVGYGKTEIALRAVFKCVMDGKQAALLVPTTILAWQHYQTVLSRFRNYPVRVGLLNRFCTPKEVKKTLEGLKSGALDIVVGTHRLLQKDVAFFDLGLLVVDEEQRFGVSHKEKIKEHALTVDVLTLTATPIPRTLNMAMGGLKDMSVLEEAPEDRLPVQTYVCEYDPALMIDAVAKELRRGGQVFWLHNNTLELASRGAMLAQAFPQARVAVAHGKMDRNELQGIWKDMMDHKLDVLVCTTIIETGVDVSAANTLIIEHADRFGLSQLHQIRGRVGRSDRKAYAYFTYRRDKSLTEIAQKRLKAIEEYTEFGSGFQLALRDLELRGAGNLLGAQQSGHMEAVGYDLFLQLLDQAVKEEQGQETPQDSECTVDLALDAYLPETYVTTSRMRMEVYKKISRALSQEELEEVEKELTDRFGPYPRPVKNLFRVAGLKQAAQGLGVEKISQSEGKLIFTLGPKAPVDCLSLLQDLYASRMAIRLLAKCSFTLRLTSADVIGQGLELLHHWREFSKKNAQNV